jgi:hypothetical protein
LSALFLFSFYQVYYRTVTHDDDAGVGGVAFRGAVAARSTD